MIESVKDVDKRSREKWREKTKLRKKDGMYTKIEKPGLYIYIMRTCRKLTTKRRLLYDKQKTARVEKSNAKLHIY